MLYKDKLEKRGTVSCNHRVASALTLASLPIHKLTLYTQTIWHTCTQMYHTCTYIRVFYTQFYTTHSLMSRQCRVSWASPWSTPPNTNKLLLLATPRELIALGASSVVALTLHTKVSNNTTKHETNALVHTED